MRHEEYTLLSAVNNRTALTSEQINSAAVELFQKGHYTPCAILGGVKSFEFIDGYEYPIYQEPGLPTIEWNDDSWDDTIPF